jgi:hypothetical protein
MPAAPAKSPSKIGTDMPVPLTAEPGRPPARSRTPNPARSSGRSVLDQPDRARGRVQTRTADGTDTRQDPDRRPCDLTDLCTPSLHAPSAHETLRLHVAPVKVGVDDRIDTAGDRSAHAVRHRQPGCV